MGMDIYHNEFIGFCFHSSSDFSEMSKETQEEIKEIARKHGTDEFDSFCWLIRDLSEEELDLNYIQRVESPDVVSEVAIGVDFGRKRPSRQELSEAKSKIKAKLPEINKRLGTDFKMKDLVRDCWVEVSV